MERRKHLNVTLYEHCLYYYTTPSLDLCNNTPHLSGIITATDADKLERTQRKFAASVLFFVYYFLNKTEGIKFMHFFSSTISWDKKFVLLSFIVCFTVLYLNIRNCTLFCLTRKNCPYAGCATAAKAYSDVEILSKQIRTFQTRFTAVVRSLMFIVELQF